MQVVRVQIECANAREERSVKREFEIKLRENEGVLVGRAPALEQNPDGSIGICDVRASKQHLLFFIQPGGGGETVWVRDLGSKNGTRINATSTTTALLRAGEEMAMRIGDLVEIGAGTRITLLSNGGAQNAGEETKCFFCLRDLAKLSLLQRELHINGCAENSAGRNDAVIAHAMTHNQEETACIVCGKSLAKLTKIQATHHLNKCLDDGGADAPSDLIASPLRKRIKTAGKNAAASNGMASRKKQTSPKTTEERGFTFTKRNSSITAMLGGKEEGEESDLFEQECDARAKAQQQKQLQLSLRNRGKEAEEEEDHFECVARDPFRIVLSSALSTTELQRRKAYFEKQLAFVNAMLATTTTATEDMHEREEEEQVLEGVNWTGTLETDDVLQRAATLCAEFDANEQARVQRLL